MSNLKDRIKKLEGIISASKSATSVIYGACCADDPNLITHTGTFETTPLAEFQRRFPAIEIIKLHELPNEDPLNIIQFLNVLESRDYYLAGKARPQTGEEIWQRIENHAKQFIDAIESRKLYKCCFPDLLLASMLA